MDSIIEVQNLTKKFNGLVAINDISFSVNRGEIFGFLGPNGAGKTTTIRMLTGLLRPDKGKILISGMELRKNLIRAKILMGVIPETGNIYMDLSSRQNIVLSGKFYGLSVKELSQKADSLLRRFELYPRRNDPAKTLSKGLKQRVNIASAIIHDPQILFLDEPTSGLDVKSQRLIRDIIREINGRGATVFLTTHNIEEANQLCHRIGIINNGRIAVIGKPEALRDTIEKTKSVEVSLDNRLKLSLLEDNKLVNGVEKFGDKIRLYTDDPDKLVKYIVEVAKDNSLTILLLQILKPSLEDAYIRFTEQK